METTTKRTIVRVTACSAETVEDVIVTEYAMTIYVNGKEFVTMVCTPEYLQDMIVGYLASERVIRGFADIEAIEVHEAQGVAYVKARYVNPFFEQAQNKRYITSCCGMSRQGFVFTNDALTAKNMTDHQLQVTTDDCFRLMRAMQHDARTFQQTGGVHNAALCDASGIILSRMDIGRHNALDKIYGHCLQQHITMDDKIIVFSGRISSEILLKVAKIGCAIVLSKSAPTELALQLADQLGITTVGFIRQQSLNIYTHPARIILP